MGTGNQPLGLVGGLASTPGGRSLLTRQYVALDSEGLPARCRPRRRRLRAARSSPAACARGGDTARADGGRRPEQELCRMPRSPTSPGGRSHSALGHWGRCRSCRRRRCSRRRPAPPSQVYADRGGTTPGAAPETRATPGIGGARQEASEVVRGTGLDRLQNLQRSRSRHFSAMF